MKFNYQLSVFILSIFFLAPACNNKKIEQQQKTIEALQAEVSRLRELELARTQPINPRYGLGESNVIGGSDYSFMSDDDLLERFKDYMSDKYFEIESFRVTGKTIRIEVMVVMNISVRSLERENESLFNELLARYNKMVFWDQMGKSVTLTKR